MAKVMVHHRMVAKPGRGDEVLALFADDVFARFDEEPGTEQYILSRSLDDPDVFWCHEIFASDEAFHEHRNAALGERFVPAIKELLVASESLLGTPLKASGVALV
jgi:quinol monooxygenase YgiN